ncbi:MAG: CBS domain-containing protein [Candidatus Thermoplasmatota archaeon]|nr:CBS domain-containing protein [Candidatus Thermoplasmatota archaeon]
MRFKSAFTVGKLLGIPINIHVTFLLIIPVFVWVFAVSESTFFWFKLGFGNLSSIALRIIFAFLATGILFFCVLLHELGHSYIALKYGTKIRAITLFIFGGIASMEKIPRAPEKECSIAIAGPLTSLAIGACFSAAFLAVSILPYNSILSYFAMLFSVLGFYNIFLACFNLLPAFPMDGGRLLRAWLATKMSYLDATSKAVVMGKVCALLMGLFGLGLNPWLAFSPMLVVIAFIIYIAAGEEERMTTVTITLENVKVRDIMSADVTRVSPNLTVEKLVELMLKTKYIGFPVIEEAMQKLEGIVTLTDVRKIPVEQRRAVLVKDIMTKNIIHITPEEGAVEALKVMAKHNIGRLLVLENGKIVGIVSRTDLMRAIQILR